MASVLYSRCTDKPVDETPLSRLGQKSMKPTSDEDQIQRYPKPARRPEPVTDASFLDVCTTSEHYIPAKNRDLLWKLSRNIGESESQICPSWTGFNSLLTPEIMPVAMVRYLPFIQAPPAEFSTIFTILQRMVQIVGTLGQSHVLITADMQIYAKAQELLWTKPPILDGKVTMRVGGMHLTMALVASFGKIYGDAGLLSLLTDSDVYAPATARQMLQGKQYARGLRGMKLVMEALFRNFFDSFENWMRTQQKDANFRDLNKKLLDLRMSIHARNTPEATEVAEEIEEHHLSTMQEAMEEFRQVGRAHSETFAFWDTLLEGIGTLLLLLRAERGGNFDLHLIATSAAVTWFHVAGRNMYAKFVPIYIAEMKALEKLHPESYKHLCDGGFVVRTSNHTFNCVATDQALEQTVNRDGKSKGGVIGLTLRKGALSRWLKTRHITGEYVEAFRTLCGTQNQTKQLHPELGKGRITRDERDVCKIVLTLSQYQNPFDIETVPTELINIASGRVASAPVRKSLNFFLEDGQKKMDAFTEKRLVQATKSKSFWDPESRSNLKTFADMRKSLTLQKTSVSFDSEVLFRRLLVVSKQRDVSLESVLEHELAPVPPALFHDDGAMRKTSKSELASKLEATCDEVHTLEPDVSTAYIIDGMALLQALNESTFTTFDELGQQVLRCISRLFEAKLGIGAIALVFDRYDNPQSTKQFERQRRGEESRPLYAITGGRTVPNYRSFLASSRNKAALALFVSDFVISKGTSGLKENQRVIVAGGFTDGRVVKELTNTACTDVPDLFSSQEEADSRMILHAVEMSSRFERLVVRSGDTDVLVLLLYYASEDMLGTSVYMHAGHSTKYTNRERYIPINGILQMVGHDICQNLPAAHALTGCDTTSSFSKVGKRTAYSKLVVLVKGNPTALNGFGLINSLQSDIDSARVYILTLYSCKRVACSTLDRLRYVLASTTDTPAAGLPPTEDSFKQHVMRARFQTAVWCQSHIQYPVLWELIGNGWKLSQNAVLEPTMYDREATPIEVRDLTHLYCSDKECNINRRCQCLQTGLKCSEFCSCQRQCCNSLEVESDSDDSDGED